MAKKKTTKKTEPFMELPVPPWPKPARKVPADGTLLRQDGLPAVFVMKGGKRRPIRDVAAFAACGFGWNEITVLPRDEIYPIPIGEEVTGPKDLQGA